MESFLQVISGGISAVDSWIWGWPLIIVLVGTHIYMTIRTRFIQRKLLTGIKLSFSQEKDAEGNVSPFAALTTALSATVGTGNIVGVATAVVSGGVGAIFWMWIIGILGMATKYAESFISIKYRVKDKNGEMLGGTMYAMENGFPGKKWAKVVGVSFAVFVSLAVFGIGCVAQSNSLCGIVYEYFPEIPMWVLALVVSALVAIVIFGGLKSISKVCEKLVPFMAIFYVLCCLIIIGINGQYLGDALYWIITCAFSPQAMIGGGVGFAVMQALQFGAARGLFSNEAGLGSAPLVDANATTRNPSRQALVSMTGVFWDTVIICAITGITLTTSILANPELGATYAAGGFAKGLQLTVASFNQVPIFGPFVLIVGMLTFSYTTILGWSWYGNRAVTYLFGTKAVKPYYVVFCIFVFFGACVATSTLTDIVWNFSDVTNALMVLPNAIALVLLAGVMSKETKHYVYEGNLDEYDNREIPTVESK